MTERHHGRLTREELTETIREYSEKLLRARTHHDQLARGDAARITAQRTIAHCELFISIAQRRLNVLNREGPAA